MSASGYGPAGFGRRTCHTTLVPKSHGECGSQIEAPVPGAAGTAMTTTAHDLFVRATGHEPYRWQADLAEQGLPETLEVPTGCGKTLGVFIAWLYRRRFHPDDLVRAATPRRLVFTLPMRTLVEQTRGVIEVCLSGLELEDPVELAVLMGGEPASDTWRLHPERDTVVVCTLDMGLSGALNRAYGSSRFSWPVTFGLLSADTHYVLDEVQLMGPAAATSRQLQAFRDAIGTSIATSSTWMSATLDLDRLRTVDAPDVAEPFRLIPGDEPEALVRRLEAPRHFGRWVSDRPEKVDKVSLARLRGEAVVLHHRPGTRTIAVVNTVDSARLLHKAIQKAGFDRPILLHSRFRPGDRKAVLEQVLAEPPPEGSIVVSTQVIEAGVDLTSATLFTEVAPWSSLVQRAGRCNRSGEVSSTADPEDIPRVFWDEPMNANPYGESEIEAAVVALLELDGAVVSTKELADLEVDAPAPAETQVLRRRDLIRLFDTAPDLGGNDLDIGPYLRDGDDLDAQVCWRELDDDLQPIDLASPTPIELCPVPVNDLRAWLKGRRSVVRLDHLEARAKSGRRHQWLLAQPGAVRPGQIFVADPSEGGYSAQRGWDPASKGPVALAALSATEALAPVDETMGDDPASIPRPDDSSNRIRRWITLDQHLGDVEGEVSGLVDAIGPLDLPADLVLSVIEAGRWHDLGKAHAVFQDTLARTVGPEGQSPGDGVWAKSGGSGSARHSRPHFRHELASALALLGDASEILSDEVDTSLTIYLVASHHGRVRMSIRSFPGERDDAGGGVAIALGIRDGDRLPAGSFARKAVPASTLSLDVMELGAVGGSWTERAITLRDRSDLGVFRLAHLEALLRIADWRVSASYDEGVA